MSITSKESTPLPLTIGKMGPYTVFVSSPATQFPQHFALVSDPPSNKIPQSPPVQAPPQQFQKPAVTHSPSEGSVAFEFLWTAVARVQKAHSSLDECVAHWLGLNQSKYQWALDDYCESNGMDQVNANAKDMSRKVQSV